MRQANFTTVQHNLNMQWMFGCMFNNDKCQEVCHVVTSSRKSWCKNLCQSKAHPWLPKPLNTTFYLPPFDHNLTGQVRSPQIWGTLRVMRSKVAPIESLPTTSQCVLIQSFALSDTVWPLFQCQIMALQFDSPFVWGYVPNSNNLHTIYLSCTV